MLYNNCYIIKTTIGTQMIFLMITPSKLSRIADAPKFYKIITEILITGDTYQIWNRIPLSSN